MFYGYEKPFPDMSIFLFPIGRFLFIEEADSSFLRAIPVEANSFLECVYWYNNERIVTRISDVPVCNRSNVPVLMLCYSSI